MSTSVSAPAVRRWRRWHRVVLVAFCAIALLVIWSHDRTARVQRLVAEIEQAGGKVELGTSTLRQFWERVQGWSGKNPTRVRLGRGATQEWLRLSGDLSDIAIDELEVDQKADLGAELARLVARHPLDTLRVPGAKGADEIAAALSANRTLVHLQLRDSDLTDEGLRRLPLERIRELNIAGTRITPSGLRALQRLPPMCMVVVDGQQVNTETASVLEQSPNSYRLWLYGLEVTNETLQPLKSGLDVEDTPKLNSVYLGQTKVTRSALDEWRRDVPSVPISYARDAEPRRPLRSRGYSPRFWSRWFGR